MLEKTTEINMLYDFYHVLLTAKQKEYMSLYYQEDYSLGEIASLSDVSRQAVYDNIRRTEQVLLSYEQKLKRYEKFQIKSQLLEQLQSLVPVKSENSDEIYAIIEQLQKMD